MKILCLFLLLCSTWAQATTNELTLYILPSPSGMDWSSPRSIIWSAAKNSMSSSERFIGHVFVEFRCGETQELTGMTTQHFDYLQQLVWSNRGLGILYYSFEGKLEDGAVTRPELDDYLKQGKVNFTRFLLNDGQCARLTTYMKEYRANKVDRYYGLANRPLYGEGAGCSAFGISFLEVAGVMDQEMKEAWINNINIPLEYAGPPLTENKVNFLNLILNADKWATEKEKHQKLAFWDPDRMYQWVKNKLAAPLPLDKKMLQLGKSQGLVMDKTPMPAPEHPIWRQTSDPAYSKK